MTDVGAVKTLINHGVRGCEAAADATTAVAAQCLAVHTLAAATSHDSHHRLVTEGLSLLAEAGKESEYVGRRLREAVDAAHDYRDSLG